MDINALGISKAKISQFQSKEIYTIEDLLHFFPRKYYDFREITQIRDLNHRDGDYVVVYGKVLEIKSNKNMLQVKIIDDSNKHMYISWFHQNYISRFLKKDHWYVFGGKLKIDPEYHSTRITNPIFFGDKKETLLKIYPVYSKIKGMSDEYVANSILKAYHLSRKKDWLEPSVLQKFHLVSYSEALKYIHFPNSVKELKEAKKRFLFDELFRFAMQMEATHQTLMDKSPYQLTKLNEVGRFVRNLPFSLTEGQRKTLRELYFSLKSGKRVQALIQGDVGCGKSIVAFILMMMACENGYQSAMIAPTQVLAEQHYIELKEQMKNFPYEVTFLSGNLSKKEKEHALKKISSGEARMIVGTHAVIQEEVKFKNLALTIVDEEHRFGVIQKNQLREKGKPGVHYISLSATPIPRSMALAIYGDHVQVLTIKTMPKNRKPVKTVLLNDEKRILNGILDQVHKGHQVYVICPFIEDSDIDMFEDVDSVEKTYKRLKEELKDHEEVKIEKITGRMKGDDISKVIRSFEKGDINVLVSTTIIEVGVNVPNATMMIIRNAERFGLAQLHQLRGRVGRGDHQSYCILVSDQRDQLKLKAMINTNDGFKIAQEDLKIRGTGDLSGIKQTGYDETFQKVLKHWGIYEKIKSEVREIYKDPSRLSHYKFLNLLNVNEDYELEALYQ